LFDTNALHWNDINHSFQVILAELSASFPQSPPSEPVIKEDARHYGEGYSDARDAFEEAKNGWNREIVMNHRDIISFVIPDAKKYLLPIFWKFTLSENGRDLSENIDADIAEYFEYLTKATIKDKNICFTTEQHAALVKAIDFFAIVIEHHGLSKWANEVRKLTVPKR
jgi:hypothetical protein